jgi:flagellar biosynthesis component FlhA
MVKHIIFSTILNVLLIASIIIGFYGYKAGNNFIPIVCMAAFGLTLFYKIKHTKTVRQEMKQIAQNKVKQKVKK